MATFNIYDSLGIKDPTKVQSPYTAPVPLGPYGMSVAPAPVGGMSTAPTTTVKAPVTTIKSTVPSPTYVAPKTSVVQPTPSPYVPPAPAGSVASLGDFNPSGYSASEQSALDSYNTGLQNDMNASFDPDAVYKQNLKLYQAQIDSYNNIYNDQLNKSRIENAPEFASRVGSQTAMAARGGLLGSDPGKAMTDNQINDNNKVQASQDAVFRAERDDKIARIYGAVVDSVTAAKKAFDETKKKSTEDYIAGIKARPEERKRQTSEFVKALLAQGIDIKDLSPDELNKFASKIGVDSGSLVSEYNTQFSTAESESAAAKLKQDQAEANLAKTVKETDQIGKMTPYQAAQIGISQANLKIAQDRAKNEDYKNFSEQTIPQDVKQSLADDLSANADLKGDEKKTLVDFFNAYPEVETEYLMKLYTNYDVED